MVFWPLVQLERLHQVLGEVVQSGRFRRRTNAGTRPAAGTFTNQYNRNLTYAPGFQNWNVSVFKNFRLAERANVQFRVDSFNWINHPNLGGSTGGGLDRNPTNTTFGKITGKGGERNMQMSLRFSF